MGIIYGIGEILSFKAHCTALYVLGTALAGSTGEEIAGIELNTELVGIDLHDSAGFGIAQLCAKFDTAGDLLFENIVVVVALAQFYGLTAFVIYSFADNGGLIEVKGGIPNGKDSAVGVLILIGIGKVIGVYPHDVIGAFTARMSRQIEEGMVCDVDGGSIGGGCGVVDDKLTVIGQAIYDLEGKIAGIAFFAVNAGVVEDKGFVAVVLADAMGKCANIKAFLAAVKRYIGGGEGNVVFSAVDHEMTVLDAVADSADDRTEVIGLIKIFFDSIVAEHDIVDLTVFIGNIKGQGCIIYKILR